MLWPPCRPDCPRPSEIAGSFIKLISRKKWSDEAFQYSPAFKRFVPLLSPLDCSEDARRRFAWFLRSRGYSTVQIHALLASLAFARACHVNLVSVNDAGKREQFLSPHLCCTNDLVCNPFLTWPWDLITSAFLAFPPSAKRCPESKECFRHVHHPGHILLCSLYPAPVNCRCCLCRAAIHRHLPADHFDDLSLLCEHPHLPDAGNVPLGRVRTVIQRCFSFLLNLILQCCKVPCLNAPACSRRQLWGERRASKLGALA